MYQWRLLYSALLEDGDWHLNIKINSYLQILPLVINMMKQNNQIALKYKIKLFPSEDSQLLDVKLHHWVHSSLCFKGTVIRWNGGTICPVTKCNIWIWTESLVMPPWHTKIVHNSRLHAAHQVNIQWYSQTNLKSINSMKQISFWEANSSLASQEIPHTLWNPKACYHIHKHLLPVPVLSLINTIHPCPFHFLKILFNSFLPPMPRSSKWSLSLRSAHKHPACNSPVSYTCHMPQPSHSSIQNTAQFK